MVIDITEIQKIIDYHKEPYTNKLEYLEELENLLSTSVQLSCSVVSNSLWLHELQHARPPCPSPIPRVHPNSCPSTRWCHPAISSSVVPFSSCPQSLPASDSFPMSQLFAWGGQSIGVSALASFLPKNTQDWSPLEWTDAKVHGISFARIWSGLPFPSPGDLPDPGIEPMSPALAGGFFTTGPPEMLLGFRIVVRIKWDGGNT